MADSPPNLDDGELWLPSDIFPDEVSSKFSPEFPSELTYMEDLAQQLAAYALLERNQNAAKPPPNLVPNLQQSRQGFVDPPRTGFGFELGGVPGVGHNLYASVNDGFRAVSGQVCQHHTMKRGQAQVEKFVQARVRVLQRQQNQGQNHFLPFQVNGTGMGGFVRESGGTGVFLPRVASTVDVKMKQSVKEGEDTRKSNPIKKAVLGKHEGLQPQAEMSLPQDWTY